MLRSGRYRLDIPWYTMKELYISILDHAIANALANTSNGIYMYMWGTVGKLGVIMPITCIIYTQVFY